MTLQDFTIDGVSYDVSQVAEYLRANKIDDAIMILEMLTGKSTEECTGLLDSIYALAKNEVLDFTKFGINGNFYDVTDCMELLQKNDIMGAMNALKSKGIDTVSSKNAVMTLNKNKDKYTVNKVSESIDSERKIVLQRKADSNWFAEAECPQCGAVSEWGVISEGKSFSGGKAAVGAVLLGPVGLAAGLMGKKDVTYQCRKCGYTRKYNKNSKKIDGLIKR